jgi:hypothetical protein
MRGVELKTDDQFFADGTGGARQTGMKRNHEVGAEAQFTVNFASRLIRRLYWKR